MSVCFCHECGARMQDTAKFCFNCGTPLVPVAVPAAEPPAPVSVTFPEPAPTPVPEVTFSAPQTPQIPTAAVQQPQPPEIPASQEPLYHPLQQPSYYPPVPTQEPIYTPAPQPTYQPVQEPSYQPLNPTYVPPVPPAPPAPPTKPAKAPKAGKGLPRRSFLNVFACVLICVILVPLILGALLLVDVRMLADEERILSALERVDLDEIPAADIFYDIQDDRSMLDWATQYMNQNLSSAFHGASYHWEDMTPKSLTSFLEDTTILEMVSGFTADVLDDLLNGTSKAALEVSDLEDFLEENSHFLEKEMELVLDRNSRKEMAAQAMASMEVEELSLEALLNEDALALKIVSTGVSTLALAVLGAVAVLLIGLLFLVSHKYVMAGVHDTGVVMVISGALMLALTGAARLLCTFGAEIHGILYLIGILAGALLEGGLLISACVFAFGILLLLISGITVSVLKRKAAKA